MFMSLKTLSSSGINSIVVGEAEVLSAYVTAALENIGVPLLQVTCVVLSLPVLQIPQVLQGRLCEASHL